MTFSRAEQIDAISGGAAHDFLTTLHSPAGRIIALADGTLTLVTAAGETVELDVLAGTVIDLHVASLADSDVDCLAFA